MRSVTSLRWRSRTPILAAWSGMLLLATRLAAGPGHLDLGFWGTGFFEFPPTSIQFNLQCPIGPLAVRSDGTILVRGNLDYPTGCARELFAVTGDSQTVVPIEAMGGVLPYNGGAIEAMGDGRWVIASVVPHPTLPGKGCTFVQRLTTDFELDPTFSSDGKAFGFCGLMNQLAVLDVAVGAAGTIYLVGRTAAANVNQAYLEVFGSSGSTHHFHDDLFFDPDFEPRHELNSIVVKPEVRGETLWVAGHYDASYYGESGNRWIVARLDTFGNYAPGFNNLRAFGPFQSILTAIALAPNGGLFFGGAVGSDAAVARLRPDGSIDTTFAGFGWKFFDFLEDSAAVSNHVWDLAWGIQPDRLYVTGAFQDASGRTAVVRAFDATGSPDASFGDLGDGAVALPSSDIVSGGILLPVRGMAARTRRLDLAVAWYQQGSYTGSSQNRNFLFRLER